MHQSRVCSTVELEQALIKQATTNRLLKMAGTDSIKYDYTKRDVILYNLGLGAKHTELSLVFEDSPSFEVLPSFGTALLRPTSRVLISFG